MKKEIVTRDQHFVQRKYLSEWTDTLTSDGSANFEINGKDVGPINLKRIMFEKDFYELRVLNEDEIGICYAIINKIPLISKKQADSFINNLVVTKALSEINDETTQKDLKLTLIQLGEDFQKCAEKMMDDELRQKILSCDGSFLYNGDCRYRFMAYLFMQYLRTPKIKNIFASNINSYAHDKNISNIDGDKIWAAIHGAIASGAANYMANQKVNVKFLIAMNENLITCDCPVVRLDLAKDKTDRFYYPFSPRIAMIVGTNDEDCGVESLNEKEVNYFNSLIRNNAKRIVVKKYII